MQNMRNSATSNQFDSSPNKSDSPKCGSYRARVVGAFGIVSNSWATCFHFNIKAMRTHRWERCSSCDWICTNHCKRFDRSVDLSLFPLSRARIQCLLFRTFFALWKRGRRPLEVIFWHPKPIEKHAADFLFHVCHSIFFRVLRHFYACTFYGKTLQRCINSVATRTVRIFPIE